MNAALRILAFTAALALALAQPASAWGVQGHYMISTAAAKALPDSLPAFVRSDAAVAEIGALGPELDRSKGAGQPHDADLDPGHYLNLDDSAKVEGVVDLDALPGSRRDYDTALRKAGSNEYAVGYLPYSLEDGWEQVRIDFAFWRVDRVGETKAEVPADRAWFATDRVLREALTLRDIGIWSHYVGDGSQPLHVTIHYDGWGNYPNPNGYSKGPGLHSAFETGFVRGHATLADVVAHMHPYASCACTIQQHVATYLRATVTQVVPLFEIEKRSGFKDATPEALDFMRSRLGDGASMLRDLIVDAWTDSDNVKVGFPRGVTPKEVETGTAAPTRPSYDI